MRSPRIPMSSRCPFHGCVVAPMLLVLLVLEVGVRGKDGCSTC